MKKSSSLTLSTCIAILGILSIETSASAHIMLQQPEAMVGGSYRAVFTVPHGCGESATTKIEVQIPEGVVSVKPMPKPGWQIDLVKGKYDKSYKVYHGTVSDGVKDVTWSGSLPNDYYDEFVLSVFLTDGLAPGHMLYFPVVQSCANGENRWTEIPADGKLSADLKSPAPALRLVSATTSSSDIKAGDLTISNPWTRATAGGAKVGGGYLTITNKGTAPDRLTAVSLTAAGNSEIHEMKMDGGVMQMRPLANGLEIKPGETVKLAPGGYHAMFMDLKEPLKEGALVKGQLTFEKAGKVDVEFKVEPIGFTGEKSGGSMSGMSGMEGHKH
ncbi:MAG: DUF1775 domain-containing protein [Rhizobiales bacterium]|nr:DUF1775 domain-containing protein [Hyphomicrobiales bacterium]